MVERADRLESERTKMLRGMLISRGAKVFDRSSDAGALMTQRYLTGREVVSSAYVETLLVQPSTYRSVGRYFSTNVLFPRISALLHLFVCVHVIAPESFTAK